MQYKPLVFLVSLVIALYIFIIAPGCANIIAPTGGLRDSLPPVLARATPPDSARNFSGTRITLTFDEYVDINDISTNLTVSPLPAINPIIDRKLHNITIKLKDTLEKNTTYAINFGNAIRDVNENNILRDFVYVFSTGNAIDSNALSGRVLLAETGKPDSTLIVVLHTSSEDSAVAKKRPRYATKLDSSGDFHFRFLAAGTYYLYAMKDEGGAKKYFSKSQLFAFADKPVIVDGSTESATLYAYNVKEETKTAAPVISASKPKKEEDRLLKLATNLSEGQLDLLGDLTLTFETPLKTFDTSKVVFVDEKLTRLNGYTITPDSTHRIYTLKYPWKAGTPYKLILDTAFASDSAGRKRFKTDTLSFKAKNESEYGSLRLRFTNLDTSKKPVLQLIQNEKIVLAQLLTGKEIYKKLFNPGEYEIRILYDTNGDGAWNPGDFFNKHQQPEVTLSVNKKLVVKSNWDNEVTVDVGIN